MHLTQTVIGALLVGKVGSLFCKIFEAVLYHRYNNLLESHNMRSHAQLGFRKNHGTLDGLFTLRHLVDKAKHQGSPLFALFIDFEKAFDRVPRDFFGVKVQTTWMFGCLSGCNSEHVRRY